VSSESENSTGTTFLLWLACVFGLCGIHRFYLGKPVTGFLYLITFGFLGVGQLIDLFRLRRMVEETNLELLERRQRLLGLQPPRVPALPPRPAAPPPEDLRILLARAAAAQKGRLTVTQGVIATGRSFEEVEAALDGLARSRFVEIDNDPVTGVVVYRFGEL
jgi:hypothetical protein